MTSKTRVLAAVFAALALLVSARNVVQSAEVAAASTGNDDAKLRHWAFKPPVRPTIPSTSERDPKWSRNPVDHFILARLEKENLMPSPEADKITLLRRLSLDLVGLPPTIAEVDAFLADTSGDAYEKQVERLLNSPHYGERWGRHWLDAARYADSDGYEKDKPRQIWFYRDWVVNALNRDMPYDQFIIEQIAGDQLPGATQDQIVATGFLRNSMLNEEGAVDPEQFRMDSMFDRMEAIGKACLGLTIQCAQCHDHKFDPISQEEYYQLFAFLNNDHEGARAVYTAEQMMRVADLTRQISDLEAALRHSTPDWEKRLAQWEKAVQDDQPEWIVAQVDRLGDNDERYYAQPDGSWLAAGYAPTKSTRRWITTNSLPAIGGFRLELLTDPNLPAGGPGRSVKGTCALTEFKVEAVDAKDDTNKVEVKLVKATADYGDPERPLEAMFDDRSGKRRVTGPAEYAIDGKEETAWGIDAGPGRRNQERKAVFVPDQPVGFPGGTILTFRLVMNHGGWNSDDNQNNNLGRFRFSVTTSTNAVADPLPKQVRDLLAVPREQRTPQQTGLMFSYWRTTVPEWKETNKKIEALRLEWPDPTTSLTLMAREDPRDTRVLRRGDWLKPTKPVTTGVPKFLNPLPSGADASRLTFAHWLVDPRSPTAARVIVNRVWQAYFGTGIVGTPEDFGLQSEAPTHPELLDWLACSLMERGWSLKAMHRLIATSATYRQTSKVSPELYSRDPYNRLLARGSRFRVEGEVVRDIALAASGLLNPALGGPSIFAPSPAFLYQPPASYGPKIWNEATGPNRYRRGLYTFRYRSVPYPMLQNFDAPNGDFSCVRRSRSNTSLQALTTLNETVFMESAQALARRSLEAGGRTDAERIAYAFRSVLSRPPNAAETAELGGLLAHERQRIADGWVSALELATGTNTPPASLPQGTTPTQLAAFTAVTRVLLNLDETITKE